LQNQKVKNDRYLDIYCQFRGNEINASHNTFKNEFYSTILIIIAIEINNDEFVYAQ
jgi:hypothetical protein